MNMTANREHTSELSRLLTAEKFEAAFKSFLEQADKNAVSKKSNGGRTPFGLSTTECDGATICLHFGQGAASKTPYMNWWVLSIYYHVEAQRIIMGIEEDRRYPHLGKMEPLRFTTVGNRKNVAVFYSTPKDKIDYPVLYERFISVAEEIMELGL